MSRVTVLALALLVAWATAGCSRQEAAWQAARQQDTPAAYERYLRDFPAGTHAADARARLRGLRDEEAWLRALRSDQPEAYQKYLATYAQGRHVSEARARLADFLGGESEAAGPAGGALSPAPSPGADAAGAPVSYHLQLGAFGNEQSAGEAWQAMRSRNADLLAGLDARLDSVEDGGRLLWRLRAGPVSALRARELCGALAARGESCLALGEPPAR